MTSCTSLKKIEKKVNLACDFLAPLHAEIQVLLQVVVVHDKTYRGRQTPV